METDRSDEILRQLLSFDGKSVEPFRQVAAASPQTATSIEQMLTLCASSAESAVHIGASWVVKDLLESKTPAPQGFASLVLSELEHVDAPDATLHLLQSLPYAELPRDDAQRLFVLTEKLILAEHAFVRAWAMNALGLAAEVEPGLRSRVHAIFEEALESEKASVKARVRKAKQRLEKVIAKE